MILARVEIDFRAPLSAGDELEIGVRPSAVGTKSFELDYEVRSGSAVAAEAKTVIVSYDYESRRSVELPQTWREALAA
jgi:acyl-CoA thioester hydrolase